MEGMEQHQEMETGHVLSMEEQEIRMEAMYGGETQEAFGMVVHIITQVDHQEQEDFYYFMQTIYIIMEQFHQME